MSGWWAEQSPEWQYHIQNEVDYAILSALGEIAMISNGKESQLSRETGISVHHQTQEAISRAIEMRDDRKTALAEGAAAAGQARLGLFVLGAVLVLLGKYCHYLAVVQKQKNANQ